MKWSNRYRMRLMLVGCAAALVLGGEARADFVIGEATRVGTINDTGGDTQGCSFLHDGLKLYFVVDQPGGYDTKDIWVATREAMNDEWGEPVRLGLNVNVPGQLDQPAYPAISPDELELYFNARDLMRTTRASKDDPWGPATRFNELGPAYALDLSADGLTVYFDAIRPGGYGGSDLWTATRETVDAPWGEPVNLGPNVNDSSDQYNASISNDGLALFFDNGGLSQISVAIRATKDDAWGPPVLLGPAAKPWNRHYGPEISPDGSTLYFDTKVASAYGDVQHFWQASITPVVDFDDNGMVDMVDLSGMMEYWGTRHWLYDMGPMPWGDGVVDVQDLAILTEYVPRVVAHWALDETEGTIAHDSAGNNDGVVVGDPTWQPDVGQVAGALQLDGVEDCVLADYVLNPADGPFSVLAWVKGGAPGQVIVAQMKGATPGGNWLAAGPSGGELTTELTPAGRGSDPLYSQAVITDGNWHCVGLVWDGMNRTLYVDDIRVAIDTQESLASARGGLNIGCGNTMAPGSYFTGLIDDVRIYNRAIRP